MNNQTLYLVLFLLLILIFWFILYQCQEQFRLIPHKVNQMLEFTKNNIKSKESFDSMAGMRPQLYQHGTAPIDLNTDQQKRFKDLEETCKHRREKCYIAGNITSCNYQYEGCIQNALWDAKINTSK